MSRATIRIFQDFEHRNRKLFYVACTSSAVTPVNNRKVGKIVYYALADAHVTQFIDVGVDHAR
jgi:hypothetical protein